MHTVDLICQSQQEKNKPDTTHHFYFSSYINIVQTRHNERAKGGIAPSDLICVSPQLIFGSHGKV